jgi:predicted nucleotidyltransferase
MVDLVEAIGFLGLTGSVPGLSAAIERSDETTRRIRSALSDFDAGGTMDVVAFGSLARQEYTPASDVDYLVLVQHHASGSCGATRAPAADKEVSQRRRGN